MKKTLIVFLALTLLILLVACTSVNGPAAGSPDSPAAVEPTSESETPASAEPANEPETPASAEPTSEPEITAPAEPTETPESTEPALSFSTTMLDGTAVDEGILKGHALTMINFFEPWCPPCVAELPELEKLYETYAPESFQILGVFSTEEGVEAVLSEAGVSYPVLRYVPVFDQFQTGYVPTTVFVNERGELVGQTQIGANSYKGWETIVKELLG